MGVQVIKRTQQADAYAVRVVHPNMRGVRVSLGIYNTYDEAQRAHDKFERTRTLPPNVVVNFKDVHEVRSNAWYCFYKGVRYGPYKTNLAAAWNRRRLKDNDTQRARRAGTGPVLPKSAAGGVRRSARVRTVPARYPSPSCWCAEETPQHDEQTNCTSEQDESPGVGDACASSHHQLPLPLSFGCACTWETCLCDLACFDDH
jgi:hypothetical protein